MTRYTTRPAAISPRADDWWDAGPMLPAISVDDAKEVHTGLTDLHGNDIIRIQPPIGFGRDGEW